MKKFVAILLAVLILCLSVGYAEQSSAICPCLCCQGVSTSDDEIDEETMTYTEWIEFVWPLIKNTYNQSTWIRNDFVCWNDDKSSKIPADVSFMLLDDILMATAEQIDSMNSIMYDIEYRTYTYKFIRNYPDTFALIQATHDSLGEIPTEYEAVDALIFSTLGELNSLHTSITTHIQENKTLEAWEIPDRTTLEDNIKILSCLVEFL